MTALCEVRIVTYKRMDWLERSLNSLVSQDIPSWRAVVFDDSPDHEAAKVIRAFNDDRIEHRPNPTRLGQAWNIDHAFSRQQFVLGSTHACILEDDNFFCPSFIRLSLKHLDQSGAKVLQWNQMMFDEQDPKRFATPETTRAGFFIDSLMQPADFLPHLPFHTGISNGGLFWDLNCKTDFEVGQAVTNASEQECYRTLKLNEPVFYVSEPQAWFRYEAKGGSSQSIWTRLQAIRARISFARHVVRRASPGFWNRAQQLADRHTQHHQLQLDNFSIQALCFRRRTRVVSRKIALRRLLRYCIIKVVIPDPFARFWRELKIDD